MTDQALSLADIAKWLATVGIPSLLLWVYRLEAKQHRLDIDLIKLDKDLRETLTHNKDFAELRVTVGNIDRLVRLIAAKQGINPRDAE